jgi:hypothetical protein
MMLDQADDQTLANRRALAVRVLDELTAAGLPAVLDSDQGGSRLAPGAHVSVDPFADAGGGVYVDWATHFALRQASLDALSAGRKHDQAIALAGAAAKAMQDAIAEILTAAGYQVAKDANDMAPFVLSVLDQAAESSWRDWLSEQTNRRQTQFLQTARGHGPDSDDSRGTTGAESMRPKVRSTSRAMDERSSDLS